jgi:hypothetical protein
MAGGGYASGKHAYAISDRSGLRFPYSEMVREWNGSLVHYSEFEAKQPQLLYLIQDHNLHPLQV